MLKTAGGLLIVALVVALVIFTLDSFGILNLRNQKTDEQDRAFSFSEQLDQIGTSFVSAGPDSSDAPKVRQEIDDRLKKLANNLREKDIRKCLSFFDESVKDSYGKLFAEYPEIMPAMAELLGQGELSALSFPENATTDSKLRTAEYRVVIDGFSFYFILIEVDDIWYLLEV